MRNDQYFRQVLAFFAVICLVLLIALLGTQSVSRYAALDAQVYAGLLALHALLLPYALLTRRQTTAPASRGRVTASAAANTQPSAAAQARGQARATGARDTPYDSELVRELVVYLQQWPMWRRLSQGAPGEPAPINSESPGAKRDLAQTDSERDRAPNGDAAKGEPTSYSQLVGVGNLLQRPTRPRRGP